MLMFSDKELEVLKVAFADNEELLYAVRNVFLQFPITKEQEEMLRTQISSEVYDLLKRRVFPEIEENAPFFQLSDMYQTLTPELNNKGVEEMSPIFESKEIVIDYLAQQFQALKGLVGGVATDSVAQIKLAELAVLKGKDDRQKYVDTKARNYLLSHIDSGLTQIKLLAGQKTESVEKTKERLLRDSNK